MRILLLSIIFVFIHAISWADLKTYSGTGKWRSQEGEQGTYDITTEITEHPDNSKTVTSRYHFHGEEKDLVMTFLGLPKESGFYDIVFEEFNTVGAGYCFSFNQSISCHYTLPGLEQVEEALIFSGVKLDRMGSKLYDGVRVAWQDTSFLVKRSEPLP